MRKFFALAALCSIVITASYFSACNNNKSDTKASGNSDSVKKVLERGEYLALHVAGCVDCPSHLLMRRTVT
ncbi:MAG: hypothetical protein ABI688_02175, partial [Bacteroidota bacterium]